MRAVTVSAPAVLLIASLFITPSLACPSTEQGFRRLSTADAEVAYRLARALHGAETALAARLAQARETTAANTLPVT